MLSSSDGTQEIDQILQSHSTIGEQSNSSVVSEEIGGTIEQHNNRPLLESSALLNNTTAGHCGRNVHSINAIEFEPNPILGSVFTSSLRY